jgi:hypothetical protein
VAFRASPLALLDHVHVSMPAMVLGAGWNSLNPSIGRVRRLMARCSCSMRLFRYFDCRNSSGHATVVDQAEHAQIQWRVTSHRTHQGHFNWHDGYWMNFAGPTIDVDGLWADEQFRRQGGNSRGLRDHLERSCSPS